MANLVVDIGNSRAKLAVFRDRELIRSAAFTELQPETVETLIREYQVSSSILSSVTAFDEKLVSILENNTRYIRFSSEQPAFVRVNYRTPETLGLDRLAGVIAAHALFPEQPALVIDAGTCITYDLVDAEGNYSGGSISPGLDMRLKAMHTFTGRLPLVERSESIEEPFGRDTRTSMLSGVLEGTWHEVRGFIEAYNREYNGVQVVLCGGDAEFFDTRLKNSIFAHSVKTEAHLVLIGLNEVIHHYND
jgi:type III pantothenate kinase